MVKYILSIFCIINSLNCCGQKLHKIEKDQFGEPLLNNNAQYSFTEKPTEEDLKKIDTSAYYIQVFEGRYYNEEEKKNPRIIIFHNDGFFKNESLLYFGKFDEHRTKRSIYYGGKYRVKNNTIQLEQFGKSPDAKKRYTRYIIEGKIENNKIIFNDGSVSVFEKRKDLPVK